MARKKPAPSAASGPKTSPGYNANTPVFTAEMAERLREDSFVNVQNGLGGRRDRTKGVVVCDFVPLHVLELDSIYHSSDLAAKVVDWLPKDALRLGWETGDPRLDKALRKWHAVERIQEGDIWGRLYGGAAIFLGVKDRLGRLDAPLDHSRITKGDLIYLEVIDRQDLSVADRVEDQTSPDYGQVRSYRIGGLHTQFTTAVHASRFIFFGGAMTSDRQKLRNEGWDLSVLQRCIDTLKDFDMSWRAVMNLLSDMSQAVFKVKNLVDMITEGGRDQLLDRMAVVDAARSVARAVILDADGEDFQHVGAANLTGVAPIVEAIQSRFAAAADAPVTKLFGISPGGLNATGASDIRLTYNQVSSHREAITRQVLDLSRIIAQTEGIAPPEEITWPSLWDMTPVEQAELESKQASTRKTQIESGEITPDEAVTLWVTGKSPADVVDVTLRSTMPLAPGEELDPAALTPEEPVAADTAFNGAQISSASELVQAFIAGTLPRESAIGLFALAFPLATEEQLARIFPLPTAPLPGTEEPPPPTRMDVASGSSWIDTEDGHRIQVTGINDDLVYFVDLDAPNPNRQYSWRRATFLERCRPAEGTMGNAPDSVPDGDASQLPGENPGSGDRTPPSGD